MLARLQESNGSLSDTLLEMAQAQADKLKATPMLRSREALLAQLIDTSHQQQRDIEEADQESFSAFLESYLPRVSHGRCPLYPPRMPNDPFRYSSGGTCRCCLLRIDDGRCLEPRAHCWLGAMSAMYFFSA
ncbi:hypothetical protein DK37_22830 [Halomonas sp. SUBG004]|nr:hypothetical protein DK37_22830 [Halomonas sp. SUBG004]